MPGLGPRLPTVGKKGLRVKHTCLEGSDHAGRREECRAQEREQAGVGRKNWGCFGGRDVLRIREDTFDVWDGEAQL